VADRRLLRALLLEVPEELSEEGAEYCIAAGIGYVSEPIRAWKAAHGRKR